MKPFRCSAEYGYRTNEDGSTDLICLYCYVTVVSTSDNDELHKAAQDHLCYPKREKLRSASA